MSYLSNSIFLLLYLARNDLHLAGIQYILDSVVTALDENPDRRFIYVEIAYFWRWWGEQTDDIRDKARQFVNEGICHFYLLIICLILKKTKGRLEFISGG